MKNLKHTSSAAPRARQRTSKTTLIGAGILGGVLLAAAAASAWYINATAIKDPLAYDTWHAVGKTWPGTIVFNAENNTVELSPLGAPVIKATYVMEVKNSTSTNLKKAKLIEGELKMVNAQGQVSQSNFKIEEGKSLTLTFTSGQLPEQYVRLSAEEAAREKNKLEKALKQGTIKPFEVPKNLQP